MRRRLSSVAVFSLITAFTASPALASSDPVGVWNLDEGGAAQVKDSSGKGNDGVLSGGATWVAGHSGTALSFDGSSGEAKVPNSASLEPTAVTVSAWVQHQGTPGNYRYIVAKGATGCIAASYGLYSGPSGGLEFYASKTRGTTFARSPDAGDGVWDGAWHLAVGTYDGSTIRLYVDGAEVGSGTAYPGSLEYLLHDSNDLFIGNYPGCSAHEFLGVIDDVTVWNRALPQSEVQALMTSQTGQVPPAQPSNPGQHGGGQPGPGTGTTPADVTPTDDPPSVRSLRLSTVSFTVDAHGHLVAGAGSTGASITYTETQAAQLTITLLRSEVGVRRASRCVKPRGHHPAKPRRCSHFVAVGSFRHADRAGHITLRFDRLLRRRQPGRYRLDVTPRAHGKIGTTVSVAFVIRRSHAHRH